MLQDSEFVFDKKIANLPSQENIRFSQFFKSNLRGFLSRIIIVNFASVFYHIRRVNDEFTRRTDKLCSFEVNALTSESSLRHRIITIKKYVLADSNNKKIHRTRYLYRMYVLYLRVNCSLIYAHRVNFEQIKSFF